MNKMKKMLAIASAAAMLCGSAATMNVSATNTFDYDINNSGSVDMMDVLTLNQYLMGVYYVSDPSILDVNGNCIVDAMDSQCLLAYTIGNTQIFTYLDVTAD